MADFTWPVSWGTKPSFKTRAKKTQYGDGYAQRVGDGLNPVLRTWSVSIANCPKADADAIVAFLGARGGVISFTWVPGYGAPEVRVVCETWDVTPVSFAVSTFTATFEEVFEP